MFKILHCWKACEICYKTMWHYPSHLMHVAGLPREIKNSNVVCRCGRKRKQIAFLIASDFVIHPQILIFSVFKIASLSPYWLQIKLFMSLFFTCLHLRSICGTDNLSQQTSLQCLSTINMILCDKDKILIKSLYLKGYPVKRLTSEFPEKRWTKRGVNTVSYTHLTLPTIYSV